MRVAACRLAALGAALLLAPAATSDAADPVPKALALVRRVLDDPMMAGSGRGGLLSCIDDEAGGKWYSVASASRPSRPVGSCAITPNGADHFHLVLALDDDGSEPEHEPDWHAMVPLWDGFAARHWPGVRRVDDWAAAITAYRPGRGLFTMRYALKEKDAEVLIVALDIRLADGRLGGLSLNDTRYLFVGRPVPAPPPMTRMVQAVVQVAAGSEQTSGVTDVRVTDSHRSVAVDATGAPSLGYSLRLEGTRPGGRRVVFGARYDESSHTARIEWAGAPPSLDEVRPQGSVIDRLPAWTSDSRRLYFVTTRDMKGRPWWQRGTMLLSMATCAIAGSQGSSVACLRPLKPLARDAVGYERCVPSPCGRYVAGTTTGQALFILDLEAAVCFLPDRSRSHLQPALRWLPDAASLPAGKFAWSVDSMCWLPDSHGLIASVGTRPRTIRLVRWPRNQPPLEPELLPLVTDPGDATLPCLGEGGKLLSYARRVARTEKWEFVVTDLADEKVTHPRAAELKREPTSISWDSKRGRWLVAVPDGLFWATEANGVVALAPAAPLKWGNTQLRPSCAAVAPDGSAVALAALLDPPQSFSKERLRVASSLFLWDGLGQQATPVLDVKQTGLPRWRFPATGAPWARVCGDMTRYGLQHVADPEFVVPVTAPAADRVP